jgi:hypothetical protein
MSESMRRQLLLNQVAQGVRPVDLLLAEVDSADESSRLAWFDDLTMAILQSHPAPGEPEQAIALAGLRPTFTPCVLVRTKPVREALAVMRGLPRHETPKTFRLLIALLGIADGRRRRSCSPVCNHWWHRDLRDDNVIESLRR